MHCNSALDSMSYKSTGSSHTQLAVALSSVICEKCVRITHVHYYMVGRQFHKKQIKGFFESCK